MCPPPARVQTRLAPGPCSLPPDSSLDLAYGIPCFSEGDLSLSSDFGNASAAADYGVSSAFLPSTVAGDNSIVEAFEWTISTNITIDEAQVQVCSSLFMCLRDCVTCVVPPVTLRWTAYEPRIGWTRPRGASPCSLLY